MISAVVISFDDNSHIDDCIAQLTFADEIIIIGTLSKDKISKLKKQAHTHFIINTHDSIKTLRKLAIQQCTNDWIVVIEADILISEDLKRKILDITQNQDKKCVYLAKIELQFMDQKIKYSGYQNSWYPILFPRVNKEFLQQKLQQQCTKTYVSFDGFNQRLTELCKRKALHLYKEKKRPSWIEFFWNPLWILIKKYILEFGFLDGKVGFIYAYIMAFSSVKTKLFLWLKYRTIE